MVKNVPANPGDTRDAGSIPGSRRSPGEGHGKSWALFYLQGTILAWRISWTEEPGGLQFMESQKVGHNRAGTHGEEWLLCVLDN